MSVNFHGARKRLVTKKEWGVSSALDCTHATAGWDAVYWRVPGHADEKSENHSIRGKKIRQFEATLSTCRWMQSINNWTRHQQLPVDVLLSALVSNDLREAGIKLRVIGESSVDAICQCAGGRRRREGGNEQTGEIKKKRRIEIKWQGRIKESTKGKRN